MAAQRLTQRTKLLSARQIQNQDVTPLSQRLVQQSPSNLPASWQPTHPEHLQITPQQGSKPWVLIPTLTKILLLQGRVFCFPVIPLPHLCCSSKFAFLAWLSAAKDANHRIIGWKRPLRSPSPTVTTTPPRLLNHVPRCHISMHLEPLQGWGLHHCPGQPGLMPDCSFRK